ncbi:MAG: CPBP family intramembrane metalloprotease, partial [Oscillospiraceae bacterium]|nr:CPBP family intramembrane metalloprotease [Oscillospiraceae bacterium]
MYKKHKNLVFTAGTFLLSYGLWAICILGQRLDWFPQGSAWFMPFYILGGNVPPIVAYFIRKRTEDGFTFKKFVKDAFALKQKPSHYALTLVMVALFYAVGAVMGGIQSETSPGLEERGVSGYIPLYLTLIGFPLFFFGGGSEELGWRGVLQPGLEKKLPFIPATVITAVVWTFWHLPLWWINGSGQG